MFVGLLSAPPWSWSNRTLKVGLLRPPCLRLLVLLCLACMRLVCCGKEVACGYPLAGVGEVGCDDALAVLFFFSNSLDRFCPDGPFLRAVLTVWRSVARLWGKGRGLQALG